MKVDNVFSLIGSDENAVTKAFAFILDHDRHILRSFLKMLGLKYLSEKDLKCTQVEIQVITIGRKEITDLEIRFPDAFYVIVESKIGGRRPEAEQLRKYAERLNLMKNQEKRLVLLTENDESNWYSHCFDSKGKFCGLDKEEYLLLEWDEVNDMIFQHLLRSSKNALSKMVIEYLDGIFMPEEILVVAVTSSQEFEILQKHHFYRFPVEGQFPKKRALYLAIYYKGIEHLAKIIEYKVMKPKEMHPLPEIYPQDYGAGTESGEEDFYKVAIDPLIKLPIKITNPRGHRVTYRYTTFEKLLTAKHVHEL